MNTSAIEIGCRTIATCSRLSFLRPCSPPSLPNCSHCSFQCHLIKTPSHLFPDYRSTHHSPQYSNSPCLTDILGFLQQFLNEGIQLDWDQSRDLYFTNCTVYRANNDTCGFNSSSKNKPLLCFRYRSQYTLTPPWIRKFKPNKMAFFAAATHNFDPKRKIRDGGFRSVYLLQLRDGRLTVVKYLHRNHSSAAFSTKSFCNEILILSSSTT
ncbi:LEAF RUST 10 DISEASE-RESISTANCE LOCUS RECEPTOR-LIKE PROTEIN KINASE-like 1.5 [Vigna angularis]|uniref:LEAF RUST 10 DISEASE-RESISTANCE LOCUS RECEPTOR-LIKE PROTEIN KINASE-like 1.5 n=1 Tax=Phaseolus angularis TaxID=3914 RepID=A0A8T0K314_PHAAN|nr:LEAF RUST 10 DISEASE-RESISTANCE LOCUS RECEPTOR-LIKE PROTEIN KINASE-like 1.5 [Vigna angularis]